MSDKPGPEHAGVEEDAIVAEVRASREAIFARADYDVQTLGQQLRERQAAAGRAGVTLPAKSPDKREPRGVIAETHRDPTRAAERALQLTIAAAVCGGCAAAFMRRVCN